MTADGLTAGVVVASNRAAAGVYDDTTGPLIVDFLTGLGFVVGAPQVVPDGDPVGEAIAAFVSARAPGSSSPPAAPGSPRPTARPRPPGPGSTARCPGIAEAIRAAGVAAGVPSAVLSRGVAGVAGDCLVVNLPGSRGGVKDGLAVLRPWLVHAVEQVVGSDH